MGTVLKHIINCHSPKLVYNRYTGEKVLSSCGKCPACMNSKHLRHVNLMTEQMKFSRYAFFCTLNYCQSEVPKLYFTPDRKTLYNKDDKLFVDISGFDDDITKEWLDQKEYVEYSRYSDFQKFLKRFRQNVIRMMPLDEALKQFKKYGTYEKLLYYGTAEYGPFTARPHFHCIIYTDSKWLAEHFGEVFYKSWSSFDRVTHRRDSKGIRSTFRPCNNNSTFAYTAAYCDVPSNIPSIFQSKELAPRHSYSKRPCLGSGKIDDETLKQRFYTGGVRQFVGLDKQGEPVILRYPHSFENRLFPKCIGFRQLDDASRMQSYFLPELIAPECDPKKLNFAYFQSYCQHNINYIISRFPRLIESLTRQMNSKRPFYGYWLSYLHFRNAVDYFGQTPLGLLGHIKEYYKLKDYYKLRDFYEFIEESSKTHHWQDYYSCHDVKSSLVFDIPDLETTSDYKQMVSESSRIQLFGMKSKKRRDYALSTNAVVFNPNNI